MVRGLAFFAHPANNAAIIHKANSNANDLNAFIFLIFTPPEKYKSN
jgi:hypothetical protein